MNRYLICLACSATLLAACDDWDDEQEDRIEAAAEASAAAAGPAPAALGLSEGQLLEADLINGSHLELGSVEGVVRNAEGEVDRFLIEVEDSNPDRFVEVPVEGLSPVVVGDDTDLLTTMTKEQLSALPEVQMPTVSKSPPSRAPASR